MSFHAHQPVAPGETIRPEPGLARGVYGAPAFFFYAVLGATALAVALWLVRRRVSRLVRKNSP